MSIGWPEPIQPMLCEAGPLPSEDAHYAYEMKWDGLRAVAYLSGGRLRLLSRSARDITVAYPELSELITVLAGREAVLDGEIVAVDADGRPDFRLLQRRMHVADPRTSRRLSAEIPVSFLAFDLLHLGVNRLTALPYDERRDRLSLLAVEGDHVATPPQLDVPGAVALELSRGQQMEGIVAKRRTSPYAAGRRSPAWTKVKNLIVAEVIVLGWKPGAGRRDGGVGSLLVGLPGPDGRLAYAGHVGTGFSATALAELLRQLAPLEQPAASLSGNVPADVRRDVRWVRPVLVGEVAYGNLTRDGRLRHPVWRGLRPDKSVADLHQDARPG